MIGLLSAWVLSIGPAGAAIDLRVESRPGTDPIEAFVRVAGGSGSVTGLTSADFAVTLDGAPLNTFTFGLPPDQDPTQKVSIVFIIATASSAVRDTVTEFISQMAVGDHAAIIKFKTGFRSVDPDIRPPATAVLQPFTAVDGSDGTNTLIDFAANSSFEGGAMFLWTISLAVGQFVTPPMTLPNGPKAIVVVGMGRSWRSQSDVVAHANANGIPIFTVNSRDISADATATALMKSLAEDTGGHYFAAQTGEEITEAFVSLAGLLNNAYRLTIPNIAVTDCNPHMLEVTAQGQSESAAFTRCDTTPENFDFADQTGVARGAVVVSDAVTITGIESPVAITVTGGEYSIGCGSTFTAIPGIILPEAEVCVRHTAASDFSSSPGPTSLIVGGVSGSFWSTTLDPPPPPPIGGSGGGSGGGGGATGVVELLLALGALLARRRRRL